METPIRELYLIGNGFDMHHRIKSSYGDFKIWLRQKDSGLFNRIYQVYDFNGGDLWHNLEYNLGLIVPDIIMDPSMCLPFLIEESEYFSAEEINISDWESSSIASEIYGFKDLFFNLHLALEEWVDSLGDAQNDIRLTINKANSFFINFNYTSTLETTYAIPYNKILYIHGCAALKEHLIFGHNKSSEKLKAEWLSKNENIEEEELESALNDMNHIYKDVSAIIKRHKSTFDKLNQVKKVHIWGLSISDVDIAYIEYIKNSIAPDATWEFSWFTTEDKKRINDVVKSLSLSKASEIQLDNFNRRMPKQLSLL